MASTNHFTSFTITQPFLGAPLQFQPALGSKELEDLIDLYVTGSASKSNKLSEITIDFYNNATVDLNTGALTRTYNVLSQWSTNEQSPASQSSGFSPVFTTSPGSSANFGDSGYGSFSMTPPTNTRGRVTKKPRKETKKEETRLPGFSIMTKDGIDVTSSAGRGTKTKEQREHAHLMRIMKACPDCKRKKIRCDPSHRRSEDMSRTSTSTTKSSSSSSSHPKPSPPSTMPSLTPQTSYASGSTPSFSPSNAIDDFVLFPEDTWNTDMSLAGLETQDLGQFNFDINDLNPFPQNSSFDFSVDSQLSNFQFDNNLGHTPLMADQYGLDQWASAFGGEEMPVHTRPHESSPARDSGRLDSSFQTSWLYDVPDVSPTTTESLAQGYFPDGSLRQPQPFQNATTDASPLTSASDWSILEASMNASPASQDASTPASSESQSNSQIRTRKRRAVDDDSAEATLPLANQRGSGSGIEVDPSDIPHPGGDGNSLVSSSSRQGRLFTQRNAVPQASLRTLPSSPVISIAAFAESCQAACDALMSISSAPVEATSLRRDLERLQSILHQVQSDSDAHLPSTVLQELPSLSSRLQVISAPSSEVLSDSAQRHRYNKPDPEIRADYLRECQIQARRIVRSLCATINSVQAHNTGTASSTDDLMLTSGRNVHLFASASRSPSPESGVQMWVESTSQWQMMSDSPSPMDDSTASASRANVQAAVASTVSNDEGRAGYRSLSGGAVLIANDLASDGPLASTVSEQQPLSQSQRGGDQVSTSLPFFDEDLDFDVQVHRHRSHAQANSAPALDTINSAASTLSRVDDLAQASSSPQNRDLQVRRTENAPPSSTLLSPGTAAPTSLVQSTANPQATGLAMQTSPDAPLGLPATTTTGHQTQSLAAHQLLLPLLATLFASYIASSNNALSPSLQYLLIPLALSSLLSTSIFACSSIFLAALSFNNLDLPRHAASQWVGSDPVVAMVKLTLCAVLTAQLPRFLVSRARMGVAVMGLLSMFDGQGCRGTGTGSLSTYSEEGEGRLTPTPEWLVEMRELTPVVVV